MTPLAQSLLSLLQQSGTSVGFVGLALRGGRPGWLLDAARDGHRWAVLCDDPDRGAAELLAQLGWDLEDG